MGLIFWWIKNLQDKPQAVKWPQVTVSCSGFTLESRCHPHMLQWNPKDAFFVPEEPIYHLVQEKRDLQTIQLLGQLPSSDELAASKLGVFGKDLLVILWQGVGEISCGSESRGLEHRAFQRVYLDPLKETCVQGPKCKKFCQCSGFFAFFSSNRKDICAGACSHAEKSASASVACCS